MSMPSWTSPRASAMTLPISRVIARARRSLCWAISAPNAYRISPRFGAGVRRHIGPAVSAALMAIATSAFVPCWKRPTTSRRVGRIAALEGLAGGGIDPLPGDEVAEGGGLDGGLGHGRRVYDAGQTRSMAIATEPPPPRHSVARPNRPSRRIELVGQRRDDPGAARADRVAERDRAAVDVDLRPVEAEGAAVGERLGGERLVDLDEVERLDRHLDPVEQAADALDRGEEQPLRFDLGLGVADDPGERREAEPLDRALAGDDGRGGAVGDPGRVAGGDRADVAAPRSSPSGRAKAGLSRASASIEESRRGPSSTLTRPSRGPSRRGRSPAPSRRRTGRHRWRRSPSGGEPSANASWSSRLTSSAMATRSAWVPMWQSSMAHHRPSWTVASISSPLPRRRPKRAPGTRYGAPFIDSIPPAIASSASPARISAAASMIALRPEPQTRLMVVAEVPFGRPALSAAWRAGAWPTPAWRTWPIRTSSTWARGRVEAGPFDGGPDRDATEFRGRHGR